MDVLNPDSAEAFRQAMRGIAGTAHLVTTSDAAGNWHGLAATAVTSVSMDPPSLLICVNRAASTRSPIETRGAFCVNVLAADHRDHCSRFGRPEERHNRFNHGKWHERDGLPYLADAQAAIFCDVAQSIGHGTHVVFIGNVRDIVLARLTANPLVYLDRGFVSLAALHV
jgi:flavin reductase (DIM6/NTAB) family NADH-FMN oxidoreductase RutF